MATNDDAAKVRAWLGAVHERRLMPAFPSAHRFRRSERNRLANNDDRS